jgi:glycogen operon protein
MPALSFIDEQHLFDLGLRNFWGYNTVGFFAPMPRYASENPVAELRDMVQAVHDAGLEIILDVAYNHTGEGDGSGPTLCFRGIDNLAYYRTEANDPSRYINDTGCGNTINADHPRVQALILDSLRYLHGAIGFDGFRFDLAPILGRHATGFSPSHPLLTAISQDPALRSAKLIAEPWDPGPGGYQLGNFPDRWAEWNDDYRDAVRRFWRGDANQGGHLAKRIHGSSDILEVRGRPPAMSINLVTAHDGFTLTDVVSYAHRHNDANGEASRDGHQHNFSHNHGVEGPTDDEAILALRRRQRLNMLATLLFSQGTPMLLAGDEFGHSQGGNNNAYAQDNETAWLDWSKVEDDPEFLDAVRRLIGLRQAYPQLRMPNFVHETNDSDAADGSFRWFNANAEPLAGDAWTHCKTLAVMVADSRGACLLAMNTDPQAVELQLPAFSSSWQLQFFSCASLSLTSPNKHLKLTGKSVAILSAGG